MKTTIESTKGANKVNRTPFDLIDAKTKKEKPCFAVVIKKDEKGIKLNETLTDLLLMATHNMGFVAGAQFIERNGLSKFKDTHIIRGIHAYQAEVVKNYQNLNMQTAKELGAKIASDRQAAKEARKASKASTGGNALATKKAFLDSLLADGTITKEQHANKCLELI